MMEMSKSELDEYANVIGIDVTGKKTVAQKVASIESARERVADIDVLGMSVAIPIKRMHDKRVSDLVGKKLMSDDDATELMRLMLGDDQMDSLVARATDDDGTVDIDAMGLAIARITSAEELKNF